MMSFLLPGDLIKTIECSYKHSYARSYRCF